MKLHSGMRSIARRINGQSLTAAVSATWCGMKKREVKLPAFTAVAQG